MEVDFFATLRQIVGAKRVRFELTNGMTVWDLVEEIVARYPDLRPELLDEEGELYPHVHVFVNGRDAPYLEEGLDTALKAGDKVKVFPAVAGG